jgi:hypothetical protein
VVLPYMHIMYFDQIHPLHYFLRPPCLFPSFSQFLVGFIALFSYIPIMYFNYIEPPRPSHFPLFLCLAFPHKQSPIYNQIILLIFLGIESTYKQKLDIFFLSLIFLAQHDDLSYMCFIDRIIVYRLRLGQYKWG